MVSGVNVVARGNSSAFNGNVEIASFDGNGPIPWAINRYNRGDFSMRLSVANSAGANANTLNQGFIDFGGSADASLPQNQAWRPNPQLGIAIPTARQNGPINWGDGVGDFYPTVAISPASSGSGYSMADGSFGNGQLDINTGSAGNPPTGSPEANFSFSVSWFPYDAGWLGGNVGNPDSSTGLPQWNGAGEHAAGLTASIMRWSDFPIGSGIYGGLGELRLPGVDALTNGMIFTTSSQGNSDVNIVGVAPTNDTTTGISGWIITVREDSSLNAEEVATANQFQFEFVYVPYTAQNLIGGYINGSTGAKIQSAGTFTLARTGAGTYEVTIPGKTGSSGTLLLQAAELETTTSVPMASRAFLSYQYNSGTGKFVIQSRKMTTDTIATLSDVNFYVTWVDFQNPLSPPDGPRLRARDAVAVSDPNLIAAKEGNLAVNTEQPEVLVTTIDQFNSAGYIDPTTGSLAQQALVGYFYNPTNLSFVRGPFLIMGNSNGQITRHDVKYNPVSHQYDVVGNARLYDGTSDLLMIARVNPNSIAGGNDPLINVFIYDGLTNGLSYDDVSLAVSSQNGNFLVVAEHKVAGEGEGTYGALFGPTGAVLTPTPSRLDLRQSAGDEDDPDVVYLPKKNVFLYISNTDASAAGQLTNRIVGSVIQTTASGGSLQISGVEQSLSADSGPAQGHPASIENPFNGEVVTAFDIGGNNVPNGQLSYYNIGTGPTYPFSVARAPINYLTGTVANPFRHQHPQLDVDPTSGTFVIGYQCRESSLGYTNAYVFSVLNTNGAIMPSQLGLPYFLAESGGPIDTGANYHNIKYDPNSDSFLVVYTADNPLGGNRTTYLTSVGVTSYHLAPPTLTIQVSGPNVILRWPTAAAGFTLESKSVINGPTWTAVGTAPVIEGNFYKVTVPASGAANFYRLRQ